MAVSILSHGNDDTGQSPTQRYAEARWRERPAISPSSWRVSQGWTLGKVVHDARVDVRGVEAALREGCNGILVSGATAGEVLKLAEGWPGGREELVVIAEGLVEGADVALLHVWDQAILERCEAWVKDGKLALYGVVADAATDLDAVVRMAAEAAAVVWGRRKRPMLRAVSMQLDAGDLACALAPATHHKEEHVSVLEYAARMDFLVVAEGAVADADEAAVIRAVEDSVSAEQELYARLGGWPERGGVTYFSIWRMLLAGVAPFPTVGAARRWRQEVLPELGVFWRGQGEAGYADRLDEVGRVAEGVALLGIRAALGWEGAALADVARGVAASVPGVTCVLGRGAVAAFYTLPDVVDVARVAD